MLNEKGIAMELRLFCLRVLLLIRFLILLTALAVVMDISCHSAKYSRKYDIVMLISLRLSVIQIWQNMKKKHFRKKIVKKEFVNKFSLETVLHRHRLVSFI